MVETLIWRGGRRVDAVSRRNLRGEDHGAAEPDIDARLALLRRADDLGAEHLLEPPCRSLRIGRPQVNMVPGKAWHSSSPSSAFKLGTSEWQCNSLVPPWLARRAEAVLEFVWGASCAKNRLTSPSTTQSRGRSRSTSRRLGAHRNNRGEQDDRI